MTVEQLVAQIHAAPGQMVLAVTGGGSAAISDLLTVPGGSKTLLEAIVPYSAESLLEFLRSMPEHFCSARTARMMAMAAFQRARHLQAAATHLAPGDNTRGNPPSTSAASPSSQPVRQSSGQASPVKEEGVVIPAIGIGCTASLASDRPKRGPHRIHVALQTADGTATHSLELIKDRRTRAEEEQLASQMVLTAVAEAFGVAGNLRLPLIETEQIKPIYTMAQPHWKELLLGYTEAVTHWTIRGGKLPPEAIRTTLRKLSGPQCIFPGAFNPLHDGHLRMWEIAARRLGVPVQFEISIENVDKPPLDYTEIERRAAQFNKKLHPLWFTRAPTFEEKSRLFPGATFVVGADTLVRVGEPRYYRNDAAAMEAAVQRIAERGCRFLVFGRLVGGKFQSLADLPLPESLRKLCDEVPPSLFREDISSTELRQLAETDP